MVEQGNADPNRRRAASDRGAGHELVSVEDAHRRAVGACQLLCALCDQLRDAIQIEVGSRDLGLRLDHSRQAGVLLAQRELGELARRDVLERRDRGPRLPLDRTDVAVHPGLAAALVEQPGLEPVRIDLARDEPAKVRGTLGIVVRVRVLRDRHHGQLTRAVAGDRLQSLVAVDDVALGVQ